MGKFYQQKYRECDSGCYLNLNFNRLSCSAASLSPPSITSFGFPCDFNGFVGIFEGLARVLGNKGPCRFCYLETRNMSNFLKKLGIKILLLRNWDLLDISF